MGQCGLGQMGRDGSVWIRTKGENGSIRPRTKSAAPGHTQTIITIIKVFTKRKILSVDYSKRLSPFLTGRMFVREPSWKYSANPVRS